jgi:hypothetical protein
MMPIRELGANILTVKANQVIWLENGCNPIFDLVTDSYMILVLRKSVVGECFSKLESSFYSCQFSLDIVSDFI